MSMIVLHLRWNDAAADQYEHLRELLPEERGRQGSTPHSRQLRHHGRAILDTEVWEDGDSAQAFVDQLPYVSGVAGLQEPQVVAFALPDMYAKVFAADAARQAAGAAARPAIPAQMQPQPVEREAPTLTATE